MFCNIVLDAQSDYSEDSLPHLNLWFLQPQVQTIFLFQHWVKDLICLFAFNR